MHIYFIYYYIYVVLFAWLLPEMWHVFRQVSFLMIWCHYVSSVADCAFEYQYMCPFKGITRMRNNLRQLNPDILIKLIKFRLAAIDGDDGYTGVKPQHRYVTCPTWHHPTPSFRFFFSNKNTFVQLEDTTIKTERACSMQCTDRTRVLHHSSLGLHCRGCPDQNSCAAGLISRIQRGNGR